MSTAVAPEGAPVVNEGSPSTGAESDAPAAAGAAARAPFLETIAARKPKRVTKQSVDLYVNANKASITRLVKKDRKKDLLGELADWKVYAAGMGEFAGLYFPSLSMRDSYETVAAEHARIASALGFELSDDDAEGGGGGGAGDARMHDDSDDDGDSSYYTGASEDEDAEGSGDSEDSDDDDDEDDDVDDEEDEDVDEDDDEDEDGEDDEDDDEEAKAGQPPDAKRARTTSDDEE